MITTGFIIASAIKVIVVVVAVLTGCAYATWLERKLVGHIQHRIGPNLAGPFGLLQPIADAIKLAFKEDIVPERAERVTYALAPIVAFIPAMLSFAVIPFGDTITIMGQQIDMVISDLNIGILYIFAITSLGVYGIVLAGWSSGSKYSLLGGIRSSAQMISYEIAYGLSIIGVLIIAQTLSMKELVAQQANFFDWFIFRQPLGFVLFVICAIAETNRSPFDMPEAESELVGGYHTEYSSLRFAMFFIGEYANMITVAAVVTTIFLGGWQGPLLPPVVWFCIKVFLFMAFYVWIRGTLPRVRYDQLMNLGWKVLFPLALLNVVVTALIYRL
ncbi:MAG: NADH-quinone oxidoreductase subunit NuoH [Candidatus Zixiibacteriota bacterium]|nr:MAG: NADH-quinone oxidoreductase subunit NuoH [candidate division Zixibacteria bacterium]HDL04032.1 NADH-quinone oxidoreductase subunit NuoH [candidate division Zixibacteria bacterium]